METYSYITVLSNWLLGYDKYGKIYSKELIAGSTFPDEFYLLKDNFSVGITKASKLLNKLGILDNKIIRIETIANPEVNTKNGIGYVINQNYIDVSKVYVLENQDWKELSLEEITAQSYKISDLESYSQLQPLTLSILPIALNCQARCWFCFSESSISSIKDTSNIDFEHLKVACEKASQCGAKRFVITGGGEPTLIEFNKLIETIELAKNYFNKTVLITNGLNLNNQERLNRLSESGLDVLSISRHSDKEDINKMIMGINTKTTPLLKKVKETNIRPRLVCVLQKLGVHDEKTISDYLDYTVDNGVDQVCFKELYVASQEESLYTKTNENVYSELQQVPLKVIINFCESMGFEVIKRLPWGSPVYRGLWKGKQVDIACYTEPSVGWERKNKIARSWNIMSDSKIYASLEDLKSEVTV